MRTAFLAILAFTLFAAASPARAEVWEFRTAEGGTAPCRAVRQGPELTVQLLRNDEDQIIVAAGPVPPEMEIPGRARRVNLSVSVDGAAPAELEGFVIQTVVFIRITDPALEQALRNGRMSAWRFPWGAFSADITGLGEAFDPLISCTR